MSHPRVNNRETQIIKLREEIAELKEQLRVMTDSRDFVQRILTRQRQEAARARFLNSVPGFPSYRDRV